MIKKDQGKIGKSQTIWSISGWILFIPTAFAIQAIGIIILSSIFIKIGLKNQLFLDSLGAFSGNFLLVFSAGYFAPSNKIRVTEIIFGIITLMAIVSFILGILGVYTSVGMETPHGIIPALQILGALYAAVLFPFLTLEQSWGKIAGLGGMVSGLGGIISIVGLILGIITLNWATLFVGTIIFGIGVVTWLFPYIHLFIRVRKFEKMAPFLIQKLKKHS